MRCLGQINGRSSAESFVAYLLTLDITTQIEAVSNSMADKPSDLWEIWVRDEDKLGEARAELSRFVDNPRDAKYATALTDAKSILAEKEKKRKAALRNLKRMDMQRSPGMGGGGSIPPLTLTLLILSIAVSLFSSFSRPKPNNEWGKAIVEELSFVSWSDYQASKEDPAASLKKVELWRVITPIFLHLNMIHLAMNMFVLISFGRMVERWLGTPKYAVFVLLLAIFPNLLQGLAPAWMSGNPNFGGMSGVLYGLFGYVWVRSSLNPNLGVSIPFPIVLIFVGMIVVGLSGAVPNWPSAELCHLGGLLIGCTMAFASEKT
jgi:GlpG protein